MRQFKNKSILELKGFAELYAAIEQAGKNAEVEGRKLFEKCAENMYDELYTKAEQAGLSDRLLEQIDEKFVEEQKLNIWRYEVGWKKTKPTTGNPLPDVYKVMFFNYGTPRRTTKAGHDRGEESAHPKGSHGFIKKAKLAAANKNRKLQKQTLEKILKGLPTK